MTTDQLLGVLATVLVVLGGWRVAMSDMMDFASKGYGVLIIALGFLINMIA